MRHFAVAQSWWRASVCTQSLSLHAQRKPWEQRQKRKVRSPQLRPALGGRGAGLELQWGEAEAQRWDAAGQGWNQAGELRPAGESLAGHSRLWGRPGGREGENRAGGWAWARTGGPGCRKLLARALLAILRVSVQTNFRNLYFKAGSPLPLPHTQQHTLIHHVEILQTHLFKKIDSTSLSARSVTFFQLCQQKP